MLAQIQYIPHLAHFPFESLDRGQNCLASTQLVLTVTLFELLAR